MQKVTNTTNIAFSSHALQRKILEIQQKCVSVCAARRGAGQHENRGLRWVILNRAKNHQHQINIKCVRKHHPPTFISWLKAMRWMRRQGGGQNKAQPPERGIPPSFHATRRYTKIHLGFCLRFSTLIGQIGLVPLFGSGPRRYIRSRLLRFAVTAFWRALTASWRQKGTRKQTFPRAIHTTELPSNPSPLTFRNNQVQILQTSSTHATVAANVSQQDTNTHGTWLSHARTHIQRERMGQKP